MNVAMFLAHDAWSDLFDVAVVLSQNTDLNEPVRVVRDEIGKSVGVLVLYGKAPEKLASFGSFVRHHHPCRSCCRTVFRKGQLWHQGKTVTCPID